MVYVKWFIFVYGSLAFLLYVIIVKPTAHYKTEIFNQLMALTIGGAMITMTDLYPDADARIITSWFIIACFLLTALVNWMLVIINAIRDVYGKIK